MECKLNKCARQKSDYVIPLLIRNLIANLFSLSAFAEAEEGFELAADAGGFFLTCNDVVIIGYVVI